MHRRSLPLRGLLTTLVLFACEARATPATPVAPTTETHRFRPGALSDRGDEAVEAVRALLDRGEHRAALDAALAALATEGDSTLGVPRLRYLAARAALGAGDSAVALEQLSAFDRFSSHPLAVHAATLRASTLAEADPAAALELLAPALTQAHAGQDRALRLASRLRLATGDREGAVEDLYRVAFASEGDVLAEVAAPLFEDALAHGDAAALERALVLAHRVYAKAPRTSEGRQAEARMQALGSRLADAGGTPRVAPTLDERIERAEHSVGARIEDVVDAYESAIAELPEGDARLCALRFGRAKALERSRDKRRVANELLDLAARCDDPEIRGFALFKAGKALTALDDESQAVETYGRLLTEARGSRFADDGAVSLARLHLARGRFEEAKAALEGAIALPRGDMRGEAYFLLGYAARERGDLEGALATLRTARETGAEEAGEENAGRVAYWEARTLSGLHREEEARAAFEALARRAPLTYYGLSAHGRLRELDTALASSIEAELVASAADVELPMPDELDQVAFARASELLFVGELALARAELERLGLLGERATDEGLYLAASLYVTTHHPNEAVELLRRRLGPQRAIPPVGTARAVLRLGYPRAFAPMVDDVAAETGVPAAFVRAIAREESSFDPTAVSRANAIGMVQILVSTARGFSREVGVEPSPTTLTDARTNVRFGARYMARLLHRFDPQIGLVPAAYNAGHAAVERWLRADSDRPFDEFVEEIPFEETRKYTRRVLQSYGVYALLDEGRLPLYGTALPDR